MNTRGIHHITAIVGDPQENVDFYRGVLGLRLVKQTVNFDDPGTYHFYFGNETGDPGTIITFFPWKKGRKGTIGHGQVGITSFAIPTGAIGFWEKRLANFRIPFEKQVRFGETYLTFLDPHGLKMELVERELGHLNQWSHGEITPSVAIKGFSGAVLHSQRPETTSHLLEMVFGMRKVDEDENYERYIVPGEIGHVVDLYKKFGPVGEMGVGTVHHIAMRAKSKEEQLEWKKKVEEHGYGVTPVRDRNYFTSIYFRDKGGILFEIATDPPGFTHDESLLQLGTSLKLPEHLEHMRNKIEETLPSFEIREVQ